jgi:hypothetical protein
MIKTNELKLYRCKKCGILTDTYIVDNREYQSSICPKCGTHAFYIEKECYSISAYKVKRYLLNKKVYEKSNVSNYLDYKIDLMIEELYNDKEMEYEEAVVKN